MRLLNLILFLVMLTTIGGCSAMVMKHNEQFHKVVSSQGYEAWERIDKEQNQGAFIACMVIATIAILSFIILINTCPAFCAFCGWVITIVLVCQGAKAIKGWWHSP